MHNMCRKSKNYTNNNQINVGSYEVTARFSDTTGNYNVPANITRTMEIVKDGKYHDLRFTWFWWYFTIGQIRKKLKEQGVIMDGMLYIDGEEVPGVQIEIKDDAFNIK